MWREQYGKTGNDALKSIMHRILFDVANFSAKSLHL
jgi:hypothetical protein